MGCGCNKNRNHSMPLEQAKVVPAEQTPQAQVRERKAYTILDVIRDEATGNAKKIENSSHIYKERVATCEKCEELIKLTGQCSRCGCFIKLKAKYAKSFCPIGKWLWVKDSEEGDTLDDE